MSYIIVSAISLLVGFVVGAAVYHNNAVKAKALLDEAETKIKSLQK